jgi:hypothetical protein
MLIAVRLLWMAVILCWECKESEGTSIDNVTLCLQNIVPSVNRAYDASGVGVMMYPYPTFACREPCISVRHYIPIGLKELESIKTLVAEKHEAQQRHYLKFEKRR